MFRIALLLVLISVASGLLMSYRRVNRPSSQLKMSDENDPLEELRRKMASDPNFNPSSDPRMMEALEAAVPASLREIPVSVERLIVAFKDATTGVEAVENLDESAKLFPNEQFISSPQSKWFKEGATEESFSSSTKSSLRSNLQREHPEVKPE